MTITEAEIEIRLEQIDRRIQERWVEKQAIELALKGPKIEPIGRGQLITEYNAASKAICELMDKAKELRDE